MDASDRKLYWKILKSEYLFTEPWFTLRRDSVKLPNGRQIPSFYVTEYPEWVNVIAITKAKEFVFVRKYRHAIGSVDYELCAGVRDREDASPLIAAQRALLEETGYGNGVWTKYMRLSANASTIRNATHCFLAQEVEKIGDPRLEDGEDLRVFLFSYEEVERILESGQIKQSLMSAPLWKYIAEKRKQ